MIIQHNYLRMCRKKSYLTQADIAFILDLADCSNVSKWEHGQRQPNIEALLTYHLLFNMPIELFFERQKHALFQATNGRVESLITELRKKPHEDKAAQRISFLETAVTRINAAYGAVHV